MTYLLLDDAHRRQMLERAILGLEAERFEAELNANISDLGADVPMSEHETAGQRVERIDRQLARLHEEYGGLLG